MLDTEATLSFLTIFIAKKFDVLPYKLDEPFSVSTSVGYSVVVERVYKGFSISLPNRVALFDLIELDMLDFDFILGMDWFNACFGFIDCRRRVIKF